MNRIPEELLGEIRARLPILEVVGRRVPLKRAGRWWMGCCPFHGEKNPSFGVRADGVSYHCFGCGAHGDVIGFVAETEGLGFREAVLACAAECGLDGGALPARRIGEAPARVVAPVAAGPDPGRVEAARRVWCEAGLINPVGAVAAYLGGRGLWPLPAGAERVLREARLRHPETEDARHPVMVARIDDSAGEPCGVHRTFLAPGGAGKLSGVGAAKLSLGHLGAGAAVRLLPAGPVLGVAEGIETALAAHRLVGMPVWSCLSAGGMERVELPPEVLRVCVFADRDKPRPNRPEGQGLHSALALADRLAGRGMVAEVREPLAPAEDYADLWLLRRVAVPA